MTFRVVALRVEAMLPDEGLVTWRGYLAGPFDTWQEAETAIADCDGLPDEVLAIYDDVRRVVSIPEAAVPE